MKESRRPPSGPQQPADDSDLSDEEREEEDPGQALPEPQASLGGRAQTEPHSHGAQSDDIPARQRGGLDGLIVHKSSRARHNLEQHIPLMDSDSEVIIPDPVFLKHQVGGRLASYLERKTAGNTTAARLLSFEEIELDHNQ